MIKLIKIIDISNIFFRSGGTDYGRPERNQPSVHGRKFTPTPKFFGMAAAYFVCHIGPIFQVSLIYAFIGCPQFVLSTHSHAFAQPKVIYSKCYTKLTLYHFCFFWADWTVRTVIKTINFCIKVFVRSQNTQTKAHETHFMFQSISILCVIHTYLEVGIHDVGSALLG